MRNEIIHISNAKEIILEIKFLTPFSRSEYLIHVTTSTLPALFQYHCFKTWAIDLRENRWQI